MDEYQTFENYRPPRRSISSGRCLAFFGFAIVITIFTIMAVTLKHMALSVETMVDLIKDMETNTRTMCHAIQSVDSNYTCA